MKKRNKTFLLVTMLILAMYVLGGCDLINPPETGDGITEKDTENVKVDNSDNQQDIEVQCKEIVISKFKDGLYGFVNYQNEWIIEPKYTDVHSLSDGYYAVGTISDEMRIKLDTELAEEFEEEGDLNNYTDIWGYVDMHGKATIEPKYYSAGYFCEGVAFVREKQSDDDIGAGNVKGYYIDCKGDTIITLEDGVMGCAFEDNGTAVVHKIDDNNPAISLSAVIDLNGNYTIPFSKELTFIGEEKYGYRSASPKERISSDQDTGVVDCSGNWVIEPKYSYINILSPNRVLATDKNGINKIINMSDTVIAKLQNGNIYTGNYGYAVYNVSSGQDAQLILLDDQGEQLLGNKQYRNIIAIGENAVYASDDETGKLLKPDGAKIIENEDVSFAYMVTKDLVNVGITKDGKNLCGLYDVNNGKWILEPVYSRIISCTDGCGAAVRIVSETDNSITYVLDTFAYNGQIVSTSEKETVPADEFIGLFRNVLEHLD